MESLSCCSLFSYPLSNCSNVTRLSHGIVFASSSNSKAHNLRKPELPKNLRHRRRTEAPPDLHPVLRQVDKNVPCEGSNYDSDSDSGSAAHMFDYEESGNLVWESDETEAIASLFQGRVPQKPGKPMRVRPLPLPLPHKTRPLGLPTSKNIIRTQLAHPNRLPVSNQIYKNPTFLVSLARDIRSLSPDDDVSTVLDQWTRFLRKGSLSLTIRELGHMGLPERALHVFCWIQKQPHLFPDDRVLASTIEVLSRARELKMPSFDMDKFVSSASRSVYEAMVKGFVKGRNFRFALRLLLAATEGKRMLDSGVYAKVILEIGKIPDKRMLVLPLLDELGGRDNLKLTQQDCTAIMKVCTKLEKFEIVEALYNWFKKTGSNPSVVMYTTVINSRYLEKKYREAMAVVWEMEASNCLLDLPAYRMLIKLFVALNDLSRTARYFSKLKESGFTPTYDIYREVIGIYMASGRLAKCREIRREAEMDGHKFNEVQDTVVAT